MDWFANGALHTAAALLAATAWTDWQRRQVPHWILVALLVVWCLSTVLNPTVLGGTPLAGLLCGVAGLAVGFGLYVRGWLGGGDGKLLGVVALWLGPQDLGFALLAAAALLLLLLTPAFAVAGGSCRSRGIPFACALAPPAAVLLVARAIGMNG